jgi:hypothetical protein
MSQNYLQQFRSSLPSTQGNQILKYLVSKRDSGEIRTVDEFKTKLKELTASLLASQTAPTFKLLAAVAGDDISSERYNYMLQRIEDDLNAAFTEADTMDEIIAAHHNLINDISLNALRFSLNELENKVSLYEFLNKQGYGFDDSLFNTFRGLQNEQTTRSDDASGLVLIDPRKHETILSDEDGYVDPIGERLMLSFTDSELGIIKEVAWLANANSIRGEVDASFKDSSLANLIDGKTNTYWVAPILLTSVRTSGVPMELALNLAATRDINYIEIEPASLYPMRLIGVDYIDAGNIRRTAISSELSVTGPTRINIGRITTNCIVLKFIQENYEEVQCVLKSGSDNFERVVSSQQTGTVDLVSVSDSLKQLLTSDFILSDVYGIQSTVVGQVKFYEYLLGFDNIRAGFSSYGERGIFSSIKKVITGPGQLGLRVEETRPVQIAGSASINVEDFIYPSRTSTEDNKFYHGSIEYWVVMQYLTADNFLLASDTFPILPIGASRVYHERIVLTAKSTGALNNDLCKLMFYCLDDDTDVLVYRNGDLLTYNTDWEFIITADASGYTVDVPASGNPMSRGIKIKGGPNPLDIYTVSYTPAVSNSRMYAGDTSLQVVIDLVGDSQSSARMIQDNVIVIDELREGQEVDHADLFLVILLRRNSAEDSYSPSVDEYMLVTGSRDMTKYIGD